MQRRIQLLLAPKRNDMGVGKFIFLRYALLSSLRENVNSIIQKMAGLSIYNNVCSCHRIGWFKLHYVM